MTNTEFDLLDELYFVQHYSYLKETLGWEDDKLLANLQSLYESQFIKCLFEPDDEVFDHIDLNSKGKELYYLATKKGLMNHNTL